jgi:TM2 domain-containing membrane protein YozV
MANVVQFLPELDADEQAALQALIGGMDDAKAQQFAFAYRSRRRDPQVILLTTLLGFFLIAGVQRFLLGQIGMGLLYLFTWGLCLIGTIIDLVNYRKLALEYNLKEAQQLAAMISAA